MRIIEQVVQAAQRRRARHDCDTTQRGNNDFILFEVGMRVEFRQGVPEGCTEWLNTHVGRGNMTDIKDGHDYAWFYERISIPVPMHEFGEYRCIPTITVKDEQLAVLFILRWS